MYDGDNRMIKRMIEYFDIGQICNSGQCFRMEKKDENTYSIIALDKYLEIRQEGKECTFFCQEEDFENFWKTYFDLEEDYGAYIAQADPEDIYLVNAAQI